MVSFSIWPAVNTTEVDIRFEDISNVYSDFFADAHESTQLRYQNELLQKGHSLKRKVLEQFSTGEISVDALTCGLQHIFRLVHLSINSSPILFCSLWWNIRYLENWCSQACVARSWSDGDDAAGRGVIARNSSKFPFKKGLILVIDFQRFSLS